MSSESGTPVWDGLIADRGGRGPTEFEGSESWDDSEEAREAYAKGVAEAAASAEEFWERATGPQAEPEAVPATRAAG